mmetsp:Transcript_40354/g.97381  ORF Transcript_40354/g.97381 Transcript_40354/m.97381 type:complete len:277 (+) Transcript_40354:1001-1831(+)
MPALLHTEKPVGSSSTKEEGEAFWILTGVVNRTASGNAAPVTAAFPPAMLTEAPLMTAGSSSLTLSLLMSTRVTASGMSVCTKMGSRKASLGAGPGYSGLRMDPKVSDMGVPAGRPSAEVTLKRTTFDRYIQKGVRRGLSMPDKAMEEMSKPESNPTSRKEPLGTEEEVAKSRVTLVVDPAVSEERVRVASCMGAGCTSSEGTVSWSTTWKSPVRVETSKSPVKPDVEGMTRPGTVKLMAEPPGMVSKTWRATHDLLKTHTGNPRAPSSRMLSCEG